MKKSKVPWNKKKWQETKRQVKILEENWDLNNSQIQDKILEILKQKNNSTGL